MFFDIVASNVDLGISSESIIDEAYDLWQKGFVSEFELNNFFAFVTSVDCSKETERKVIWLKTIKDDYSAIKMFATRKTFEKKEKISKHNVVKSMSQKNITEESYKKANRNKAPVTKKRRSKGDIVAEICNLEKEIEEWHMVKSQKQPTQ